MRTLVITPTYDERDCLEAFLDGLFSALPACEVLVVDDASPDGTGELADAYAARDPRVSVLHRAGKLGLGSAYVEGFRHALAAGYDAICEMDADGSHDPRYLPAMLAELASGRADLVLGSRNVRGGGVLGWGLGRHALSKGGSLYARTLLGVEVRDMTTGYKAFSRAALLAVQPDSLRSNGYAFQVETTFRALRRGLRVRELPIVFEDRRVGRSKMSRRIFAEAVVEVVRLRLDAARGRL